MTPTKEEILNVILENPQLRLSNEYTFKKRFPEMYNEITSTKFTGGLESCSFRIKLYHYLHNDLEMKLGICPVCGDRCKINTQNFFKYGYNNFCSRKCSVSSDDRKQKYRETCLKKYGVDAISKTKNWKTKMSNFIATHKEEMIQVAQKRKLNWKNKSEEEKQRFSEMKKKQWETADRELILKKQKQTCLEKFGTDNYFKTDEFKERSKQTRLEKYNDCNYTNRKKARQTCIEKFGVPTYMETEDFSLKSKKTLEEKYGVDNFSKIKGFSEIIKKTKLEHFGDENFNNQEKIKQTTMERYGVEHYSQTPEFNQTHKKRIEYDGRMFDSSWEVDVYKYCRSKRLIFEYQPDIQFTYEYDGKTHFYNPDFLIEGQFYEVKGDYFFEDGKMINPFDRSMDGLYEAKHQCMLENNVIILQREEINALNLNANIRRN